MTNFIYLIYLFSSLVHHDTLVHSGGFASRAEGNISSTRFNLILALLNKYLLTNFYNYFQDIAKRAHG